ncbi:hypothetical protein [Kitasatospora cheerisanensis]|uniref:Uncharacterized protein n=1 Tax=Kitasatospora cheerisanensis KCTC 2395 TaxID=1348663 RepID=A0A066YJW3_9ACTN|nr:hypothetical protein [Kitasatospora cheerisanensis]KDN81753.1 hypothetical protein KCH_64730 [Kitasatospora cheerisanensis KCTC 2395]
MPGQGKRRRKRQDEARRNAARHAPEAGTWEVLFTTQDEEEWAAYLRRFRAERPPVDESDLRMDMFCGRLIHPTTYRLSRFVPHPAPTPPNRPAED